MKYSVFWGLILIAIQLQNVLVIPANQGLEDFNRIPVSKNGDRSSEENRILHRTSVDKEAWQEPKRRQNRKVNIHVQVMTSEPEFVGDIASGMDHFAEGTAIDEGDKIVKFGDIADEQVEYDVDDYFGDENIGGSNISDVCKDCLRKKIEKLEYHLMPAHRCDQWDLESRTCWLDRNIGGTVTFALTFKNAIDKKNFPDVTWRQEFHILQGTDRIFFIITTDNLLWNTVISSGGHEFRISPISEMDVEPNRFSAYLADPSTPVNKVHFKIRIIPIDLGFVYLGETFIISMDSYISLPVESMAYMWYMEVDTETGILPSNMRSSPSGSVLTISELRKEQEGIVSCSVFTNLGFLIARKRFIIKNSIPYKKHSNPSTDLKKPGKVSPSKKEKVIDQLKHGKRFQTKRRDVLSKAQKQLEAALLALQYHNAQRGFNEEPFENERYKPYQFKGYPYQTKESESSNNIALFQNGQLSARRLKPPFSMSKTQQQQIVGRTLRQNSPEHQQRFPFLSQKNTGRHYFEPHSQPIQPLIAIAGSRVDIGRDARASYQSERQRLMQQLQPLPINPRFYNKISRPQMMHETPTSENRRLSYQYLKDQHVPQPERGRNFQNNMQTRPKSNENIDMSHPDDQISMLIAECQRNTQCSSHAKCVTQQNRPGFCRCLPNYRGNGISCWEFSSE